MGVDGAERRTGVEHVVLDVPAERGEHHAHVQPGQGDPRDVIVQVLQEAAGEAGQVVQVPGVLRILPLPVILWQAAPRALSHRRSLHRQLDTEVHRSAYLFSMLLM